MDAYTNINDLTYLITRAVFEVNSTLGFGFLEKVYECIFPRGSAGSYYYENFKCRRREAEFYEDCSDY